MTISDARMPSVDSISTMATLPAPVDVERVHWTRRLWAHAAAPFRPAASGLRAYAESLDAYGPASARALVLGATPELIDLMIERQASRVVAMDISLETWLAVQGMGRHRWSDVEWIHGDWLTPAPALQGAVDVICCDGGTLFLDWPTGWRRLFEVAFETLAPGGVFITKTQDMRGDGRGPEAHLAAHIERFERARRRDPAGEMQHFRTMISSLHVALFLGTVRPDASLDPAPASVALRRAAGVLRARYAEPRFADFIDLFFEDMDPLRDPRAVLAASPSPEAIAALLEDVGFVVERADLPADHAPAPGVCSMFTARRPRA